MLSFIVTIAAFQLHQADEAAERHQHIDGKIDQHRQRRPVRFRRQTNQHEADIVDRAIGQQPLQVLLADCADRTDDNRHQRATTITICCHACDLVAECLDGNTDQQRAAATLGALAKKAVTGVGAPS
jgi:hypothetical protein